MSAALLGAAGCSGGGSSSGSLPITTSGSAGTVDITTGHVSKTSALRSTNGMKLAGSSVPLAFSDSFENGLSSSWTTNAGTFAICQPAAATHELCASDPSQNLAFAGATTWTDYAVQMAVRPSATAPGTRRGAGMLFRAQDAQHYYLFDLVIETNGSLRWEITRYQKGAWSSRASGPFKYVAGQRYILKMNAVGSTLTASVSSDEGATFVALGAATDTTYANGGIGVRAWGGTLANFDDVNVTSLVPGATPAPQPSPSKAPDAVLMPGPTTLPGAVQGTTVYGRDSGSVWAFGEDLAFMFSYAITPNNYTATISPAPVAGSKIIIPVQADNPTISSRNLLEVRWNKVPGQTYTVTIYQNGSTTPVTSAVVRTAATAPVPQAPIASKAGDPYYYGSLEHSTTFSYGIKLPNSGDVDPREVSALSGEGVHFIRFGPTPGEVAANATGTQSRQNYSFASTDPALQTLHNSNITALYVIDAAPAPKWGNPNTVNDSRPIFETPALYAEYCSGVASHIATALPWVTRVEIGTNEPNYSNNWQNRQAVADGMAQYADTTGVAFAQYAKACYAAIKAVAPTIAVVAPGITVGSNAYPAFSFVDNMYANGCRTGVCWDIMGIHSYSWIDPGYAYDQPFIDNLLGAGKGPGSLLSYRALQQRAKQDGDAVLPPVMITEMGYSSYANDVRGVDPNVQAYYTSEAFNAYLSDPTVRGIVYADVVQHETSGIFSGIAALDAGLAPNPVGATYKAFATR